MRQFWQRQFERAWYRPRCSWTYCLLPVAILFFLLSRLRRALYRCHILPSYRSKLPVIVVGNISVGGNGKTPLVIYLAKQLQQRGYKPAIISRGYGGSNCNQPRQVQVSDSSTTVGDEALMMARRVNCPVIVTSKRVRAVQYVEQQTACDIIISDDGLQHYALQRDIEIVTIDGLRYLGNQCLLPMGPLRESRSRLREVDLIVLKQANANDAYRMDYQLDQLHNLAEPTLKQDLTAFATVHAVAGIANPQSFFQSLRAAQLQIIEHVFADHHQFKPEDLQFDDDLPLIMTEKDAVKCQHFAAFNYWFLPIDAILSSEFMDDLQRRLYDLD